MSPKHSFYSYSPCFLPLCRARGFLGAAEVSYAFFGPRLPLTGRHYEQSGLLPGLTYYLCAWYPRFAQAKRIGFMLSGVSFAGAFGGLLAFVIQEGMHGYASSSSKFEGSELSLSQSRRLTGVVLDRKSAMSSVVVLC